MTEPRKNEAQWQKNYSRWAIKVQRSGTRRSFYSTKPGRKGKLEAERKADTWLNQQCQKDNIRFGELSRMFLASIDTGNGTAHKVKLESIIRIWLMPRWEHKKVNSLTNLDYDAAVRAPAEADPPRSSRTCGHVRAAVTALWKYAHRGKISMEQPFEIKIPKTASRGERHTLQPEDVRRLFTENFSSYYLYAFRLCVLLGLRRGELCGLKREDFDGETLTIRRAINSKGEETLGKTLAAQRTIVVPELGKKVIQDQLQQMENLGIHSQWLFPNQQGDRLDSNSFYKRWLYFRDHQGFPKVNLHELRHTMVSLTKNDIPLPLLQSVVGHTESMDTIETYGHVLNGERTTAAHMIDEIYGKILSTG